MPCLENVSDGVFACTERCARNCCRELDSSTGWCLRTVPDLLGAFACMFVCCFWTSAESTLRPETERAMCTQLLAVLARWHDHSTGSMGQCSTDRCPFGEERVQTRLSGRFKFVVQEPCEGLAFRARLYKFLRDEHAPVGCVSWCSGSPAPERKKRRATGCRCKMCRCEDVKMQICRCEDDAHNMVTLLTGYKSQTLGPQTTSKT